VTSQATSTLTLLSRGSRAVASTLANARKPAGVGGSSAPCPSRKRTPRAPSMPAPASLVELPPIPITRRSAPASSAANTSCPSPLVSNSKMRRSAAGTRSRPLVDATSSTAYRWEAPSASWPVARAKVVVWRVPRWSDTSAAINGAPSAAATASVKPSPPSAIGSWIVVAVSNTSRTPDDITSAACGALIEPLNESGAQTTYTAGPQFRATRSWYCG